jgi:hypothetical protein
MANVFRQLAERAAKQGAKSANGAAGDKPTDGPGGTQQAIQTVIGPYRASLFVKTREVAAP